MYCCVITTYMIYVLFVVNIEVNNVLLRYEIHPIRLLKVFILHFDSTLKIHSNYRVTHKFCYKFH